MAELIYLSLGSNLKDRHANLRTAIASLAKAGTVRAVSSFCETEPVENTAQPWFVNCAVALETDFAPVELLQFVLKIEQEMGRVRRDDKGPRLIDIDILLYGDRVIDEPGLKIPHPALHRRRFVLQPLAEIAPHAVHPILRKTVSELLSYLPAGQTVRAPDRRDSK